MLTKKEAFNKKSSYITSKKRKKYSFSRNFEALAQK
jgi:hypothetical protein